MQAHALLYTDRRHDGQCSPTRRAPVENFGEELLAPIKKKYIIIVVVIITITIIIIIGARTTGARV
jgi:hypothetical protein